MKRHPAMATDALEDLEQLLRLRLLESFQKYSHERGHRNAFATAILDRYCATMLRNVKTQKRYPGKIGSLSAMVWTEDGGPTELAQLVDEREHCNRRQIAHSHRQDTLDLALDLAEAIAGLPPELRQLADLLKYESPAQIVSVLGAPRSSLYEQIRRLRRRFEHSGLNGYLEESSSHKR